MPKLKDLRNKQFGDLTVLNEPYIRVNNATYWKCKCKCGTEKFIFSGNLISGNSTSCGCKRRKTNYRRLIVIFNAMKQRCYNKKHTKYKNYGGRGISICNEWLFNSNAFYSWAITNGYNDDLTIDRIDVNGNYEPSNCRWVTMKTQQNNRTNNKNITMRGQTKTLSQWSEEYGLTRESFIWRYNHNLL